MSSLTDSLSENLQEVIRRTLPDATVLASAPGRANLIGEHTDYNGFGVLPIAIDRRAWVAIAPRDEPTIRIHSLDPARYPEESVPTEHLADRTPRGTWVDYVVAGLRPHPPSSGCEILVAGDVPPAAGIASSSALVVATMVACRTPADRHRMAHDARLAERYVGTLSGGMDQAIALLARPDHALQIDFDPLRVRPIRCPDDLAVILANSGVRAAKGGAQQSAYNDRVLACTRAAEALGAPAGTNLSRVAAERRDPNALRDPTLARRARFVFEEAERRDRAVAALLAGDLRELGALVDRSHEGLRDLYEVSHPAVDELVESLRGAGALGARIVGAGFGGCAIAIAHRDDVGAILEALPERAFSVRASGGAERLDLT